MLLQQTTSRLRDMEGLCDNLQKRNSLDRKPLKRTLKNCDRNPEVELFTVDGSGRGMERKELAQETRCYSNQGKRTMPGALPLALGCPAPGWRPVQMSCWIFMWVLNARTLINSQQQVLYIRRGSSLDCYKTPWPQASY